MTKVLIQARLNTESFAGDPQREAAAIEVFEAMRKAGWDTRSVVREGLIALGERTDQNWYPPPPMNEVRMTMQMTDVFKSIQEIVLRLSKLDFSSLNGRSQEDARQIISETAMVKDLFSQAGWFDEDEDSNS